ncbi:MAG: DUF3891 family protein [Waterburya sp.]
MIVNLQSNGWEIIYHRAHALLAAQIASAWNLENSLPGIFDTIAAISHHDDLEKEWEENLLTPAGAPMDFTLEQETPIKKLSKHIEDSLYRGRWVALLTSMHLCFLNQGSQDKSSEIKQFIKEQTDLQTQWRKELGVKKEEAESAYKFMKWCDRLSLILCQRQIPDNQREVEINQGADGKTYYLSQSQDGYLTVTPWCFTQDKFTVKVEASYLSQIEFADNKSLKEALKIAPRKYLEWTFMK